MVYNCTVRRGPIGAMSKSPGPAKYVLPSLVGHVQHDPRSVHVRGPSYKFGLKLGTGHKPFGPGPGAHSINPKVQINGPEYGPAYSLAMRFDTKDKYRSPGPAAYMRDDHFSAPRPAAYTFGVKHREDMKQNIPGPNLYHLRPLIGPQSDSTKPSAPEYSMGLRIDLTHLNRNPGPGTYKDVPTGLYKSREPHYTMLARNFPPDMKLRIPGPGAHSPEKVTISRPQAPKYSFGIRHSEYIGELVGDGRPGRALHCSPC